MNDRLKRAFEKAAELPEGQQDAFAEFLLQELEDEKVWQSKFATSAERLAGLAKEAKSEYRAGETRPLDL